MANQDDEANKPWMIRDVSPEVRKYVKIYAVQHDMTVAQALEALVDVAKVRPEEGKRSYTYLLGMLLAMYDSLMKRDIAKAYSFAEVVERELEMYKTETHEPTPQQQGKQAVTTVPWPRERAANDPKASKKEAGESRTLGE